MELWWKFKVSLFRMHLIHLCNHKKHTISTGKFSTRITSAGTPLKPAKSLRCSWQHSDTPQTRSECCFFWTHLAGQCLPQNIVLRTDAQTLLHLAGERFGMLIRTNLQWKILGVSNQITSMSWPPPVDQSQKLSIDRCWLESNHRASPMSWSSLTQNCWCAVHDYSPTCWLHRAMHRLSVQEISQHLCLTCVTHKLLSTLCSINSGGYLLRCGQAMRRSLPGTSPSKPQEI